MILRNKEYKKKGSVSIKEGDTVMALGNKEYEEKGSASKKRTPLRLLEIKKNKRRSTAMAMAEVLVMMRRL